MQSRQNFRSKQSRSRKQGGSGVSPLAAHCLQVVDLCLLGVLFLAPLFFGGRHLLGRLVFIVLASTAGVAWLTHQALLKRGKWTRTWANVLGLAAILLVVLQLVPLPTDWIEYLVPRNASLLALWNNGAVPHLGDWQTLSLTPSSTKIALATLIAYVLLFVTVAGRLRERADIERLIRMIALAVILMAGFGILQYFTSNGLYFWFYEYPYSTASHAAKGSFTTKNHFAHFLALGTGPLLAWIVLQLHHTGKQQTDRQTSGRFSSNKSSSVLTIALHAGLVIVALAALLSFSRGGILALLIASTIAVAIFARRGLLSSSYLYGLAMLGLLVVGLLSLSGYDRVAHRLNDFASVSIERLDQNEGRRKIWAANVLAIQSGSLLGSGAGSHCEIYPIYFPKSPTVEYTHAENGYLQIGTENGFLGVGLLALAIMMVGSWCWQALRHASSKPGLALAGAVTASLAVSLIHSTVDFVWFIPSCMSLTILLAACALRLAQLATYDSSPSIQPSGYLLKSRWIGLTASAICAAVWALSTVLGPASASTHWDKYLLTSADKKQPTLSLLASDESLRIDAANRQARTKVMIYHLQNTLTRDPQSARAHLRLAGKYLQLFDQRQQVADNSMSVDQIREAAIASKFASSQILKQWLLKAFGENSQLLYRAHFHTRQALRLCPLQGEGYLYLANLCFLEGHATQAIDAYVQQSLQVRPHSGRVLFEAGRQRFLLGQVEQGFSDWQQIYHDTGPHQQQIVHLLTGQMPAAGFLELFEPGWSTLPLLWKQYRQRGSQQDWQAMIDYTTIFARKIRNQKNFFQAAYIHNALANMHRDLDHPEEYLNYVQKANAIAPNVYTFRRSLGRALLQAKQYPLAVPHLRWCLARRPEDRSLQRELIEAKKSRLPLTANTSQNPTHR